MLLQKELRFLVGPTAAGKSALALELAERAGASIVSLDSMQVYRSMDIGTAKPSPADRARVPHFALDLVEPSERYDVQRYLADVREALMAIGAAGRRALFVGGTGFYLKALTHGLFGGPPVDPRIRAELQARARAEGSPVLHAELASADPSAAARIHPNDVKRVVRALEVLEQTGRPLSSWQREWGWDGAGKGASAKQHRIVGLHREPSELEARIPARTRAMLAGGWIEETLAVRDGPGFGPTAIQALGYREVLEHLEGRFDLETCADRVALRTRQFARRQRTWFRSFPEIRWIEATASDRVASALAELERGGWDVNPARTASGS